MCVCGGGGGGVVCESGMVVSPKVIQYPYITILHKRQHDLVKLYVEVVAKTYLCSSEELLHKKSSEWNVSSTRRK